MKILNVKELAALGKNVNDTLRMVLKTEEHEQFKIFGLCTSLNDENQGSNPDLSHESRASLPLHYTTPAALL